MARLYLEAVVGLALVLAIAASVLIVRSNFGSPLRKASQFLFVWLIPLVGPIVAIVILRSTGSAHASPRLTDVEDVDGIAGIGPESIRNHLVDHSGIDSIGGHDGH